MSERLLTHVEFRSYYFPAFEGEEDEINPGLWGKLLADFLRDGLISRKYEIAEPIAEDWGWMLKVLNQPFRMWIGCGHYPEFQDGFLCFIHPHKTQIWSGLRKIKTLEPIKAIQAAMDEVLNENERIRDKRWWTHEEFNNPARRSTLNEK